MSGKGKRKEVECCGESRRKHGKRPVTGYKICLGKGNEKEIPYQYPDGRIAENGYWYREDGKDYLGNAECHEMTDRESNKYMAGFYRSGCQLPNLWSTRLELKKVKKAIMGPGAICFRWHITFDVLDPEDDAKPTKVFQAKLDKTFEVGVYVVVEVHPKPTAANRKKKGQDKVDQVHPKPTAKTTTSKKKKGRGKDDQVRPKPTGAA